ncbi:MAG TPA: hypothetical protein VFJ61_01885 [Solirubrobacterales bacterium]|nr:hypothetical protein [Solirubrobacterales bacterium]
MIVQWCCKGVNGIGTSEVQAILQDQVGLSCRFWQEQSDRRLPYAEALGRLSERDLDLHVNHYDEDDPATGRPVKDQTVFISLSAGCVERNSLSSRTELHPALRTALIFATDMAQSPGWVFTCYVLLTTNRASRVPGVAEEVRELNHQRAYSHYWAEGEIAAKINVPSRQILCAEYYVPAGAATVEWQGGYRNLEFVHPDALLNMRQML